MQPIYKGNGKDGKDPASYRGICLTCATTKLFEGLINNRQYSFITEKGLDQELTMKPFQQQILDKTKKSNGKLQGPKKDIKTSRHLYSPQRSTLGRASTTSKTLLHLWKSCVLVQATQYIRYIPSDLVPDIQTKLQKSLQDTFECYTQKCLGEIFGVTLNHLEGNTTRKPPRPPRQDSMYTFRSQDQTSSFYPGLISDPSNQNQHQVSPPYPHTTH